MTYKCLYYGPLAEVAAEAVESQPEITPDSPSAGCVAESKPVALDRAPARRNLMKGVVGASLLALPSWAIALIALPSGGIRRAPKITRLLIGLHPANAGRQLGLPAPPYGEYNYEADVIEYGDKFYYRAKGVILEITELECRKVKGNPVLHYFSTALKLHKRIQRKEGILISS